MADKDDIAEDGEDARASLFSDCAWTALAAATATTRPWRKEVRILVTGRSLQQVRKRRHGT